MRFIFISSDFNQGGVTSSMRNLCNELIRRGHLVDILNLPGDDKLPEGFSNEIRLIPVEGFAAHWNLGMHTVRREKGIKKLTCLLLGAVKKLCNRSDLWNRIVFSNLKLDEKYDIAIGFRQSPVCYWLAASKCKAKISIGFWHTDADFENVKVLEACMAYPDRIACVSDAVTMQMKKKYPHYAEKFAAVYNLFDPEDIRRKCLEASPYGNSGEFKIVTVSRLVNSPKKIDTIPQICLRLARKSNRPFRWYVVGEGADRAVIEAAIQETCTEKYITLCGSQTNPYPFMSNADLFVLCSSWESYGDRKSVV